MSFLREFLPAPIVSFLPVAFVLLLALLLLPRLLQKLRQTGVWERILDKVGGEKLQLVRFEREIARLKKKGDLIGAGRLYEEAEWYAEAIQLYVEAEEYTAAGSVYEMLQEWDHAAEMYSRSGDWKRAAGVLAKAGNPSGAAEIFEQHGQKTDAAKLFFEAGRFDRAAELYEESSNYPQAAKARESLGDWIGAAENYEKQWSTTASIGGGGLLASGTDRDSRIAQRAGDLYEKGGDLEKAAAIYARAGLARHGAAVAARLGRFGEAGEMLVKEEKLQDAAEMFEKAGDHQRAALLRGEVAFHQGDSIQAAREFLKGGDNLRAAELFESGGDLASAASCYEQSDSPLQAGHVYLRAGSKDKAAAMFEKAREYTLAAGLFAEVGERDKASTMYEMAGLPFEAGKLAHDLGNQARAIQLLQRIDPGSEHYEPATLLLSRMFIDRDMASLAVEKLLRSLGDRQVSSQTLELFYCLGRAYEKLGKTEEAIATYKKVMAERYGYEDVEDRVNRLTRPHPTPPAPPPASAVKPKPVAPPARPQARPVPRPVSTPIPAPAQPTARKSTVRVAEKLGQGLLGTTFRGIDTRNNHPVIVKFLRPELLRDESVARRFMEETRMAKALQHPNLARLLGVTEIDGRKAAVMEWVEGVDLASFLGRSKRLTLQQGLDLLTTLATALNYLHQNRLVHRDLKMTNVLLAKGGRLRLTGIGLGALRTPDLDPADGYVPPEFLRGRPVDERYDVYSLGGLAFHGLSGQPPPSSEGPMGPSLHGVVPSVPEPLAELVSCCLAPAPESRFPHMSDLLTALGGLRG